MGRGGKRGARRGVRAADKVSDESDEDYAIGEEELDESDDEYVSSFDGDESEDSLGEFKDEEEEEEFIEKKVKRVGRPKKAPGRKRNGDAKLKKKKQVSYGMKGDGDCKDSDEFVGGKRNRATKPIKKKRVSYKEPEVDDCNDLDESDGGKGNGVTNSRKKKKVSYRELEDDEYDDLDEYDGEKSNAIVNPRKKKKVSYREQEDDDCDDLDGYDGGNGNGNGVTRSRKKTRVSYSEQGDDNYDDSDEEDDDEEFTPDEVDDDLDDEVVMESKKDKKLARPSKQERIPKERKRKRNSKVLDKNMRNKQTRNHGIASKTRSRNHVGFTDHKTRVEEKKMKITRRAGRKKRTINSDSDFESSGLSDYEYTISEEEREQVREANEFCRNLTNSLRSVTPVKKLQEEEESVHPQIKHPGRKGKEKEEVLKIETGKQVCGICLSEEGKRTVRGLLNCCSHYFCFACIMEWSKVESRCPLCKQRFVTITKPARFDLRPVVIPVPERDQVYQPSEEELRGYLDPYENVICTECQQGGDDALMLLCDLCDSPAHTYCVGLGHEVPEGNWYCEGCRPATLDSSNPQGLNPTPDHRTINNLSGGSSPDANVREIFDLNEAYVPDTPLTQGTGLLSPRLSVGDFYTASPASGSAALTVLERRRIQQQIRQIFNIRRQQDNETYSTVPTISGNSLFSSQVGRGRVLERQHTVMSEGRMASYGSPFQGRFQGNTAGALSNTEDFRSSLTHLRGPVIQSQASASADGSVSGFLQNDFAGINASVGSGLGLQQVNPFSGGSNIVSDAGASAHPCREVSPFKVEKDQLQSMVRSHLKRFSRDLNLEYSTFKDIARSSTHTILAACGLEHRQSEVCSVQTPLVCRHVDSMAGRQICPMKSHCCSSCFDLFMSNVVREIIISRTQNQGLGLD